MLANHHAYIYKLAFSTVLFAARFEIIQAQIYGPAKQPLKKESWEPLMPLSANELGAPLSLQELENGRNYKVANRSRSAELMKKGLESEQRLFGLRSIQRELYKRWPNNDVPYTLDSRFTPEMRTIIASGFQNIQDNVCVTFRPKVAADLDWVEIKGTGPGCSAEPLFRGPGFGAHVITLEIGAATDLTTCVAKGVVVHELLHVLGVAHEQQRPDRDQYITIDWTNCQVNNAYNLWRDSWETEDVSSLKRCNDEGVTQATANFNDCVSGDTVTSFGFGYDFKSVMHYALDSFAVDSTKPVMIPKDPSITQAGAEELSALDIRKLRRGYHCESSTEIRCGGNKFSGTGGPLTGATVTGTDSCQTVLSTEKGKAIRLNASPQFGGTCDTDFLEVRLGKKRTGKVLHKFCKDTPLVSSKQINADSLFLTWKKTTSSMTGTWSTVSDPCSCQKLQLTGSFQGRFDGVWTREANFGAKSSYSKDEIVPGIGKVYLYYYYFSDKETRSESWNIFNQKGEAQFFYSNKLTDLTCGEDLTSGWQRIVGNGFVDDPGATVKCLDPTTTPGPTTTPATTAARTTPPKTTANAKQTTAPGTGTTTGKCKPCENVKEGPLKGKYTLKLQNTNTDCPDGCVYSREGDQDDYCLQPNGLYATDDLPASSCGL